MRDASRRETVDEVVNILDGEELCLKVFKRLVSWSRDYEVITEELINENKEVRV